MTSAGAGAAVAVAAVATSLTSEDWGTWLRWHVLLPVVLIRVGGRFSSLSVNFRLTLRTYFAHAVAPPHFLSPSRLRVGPPAVVLRELRQRENQQLFLGTVEARLHRIRLLIERLKKEEAKDRKTQLGMTVCQLYSGQWVLKITTCRLVVKVSGLGYARRDKVFGVDASYLT